MRSAIVAVTVALVGVGLMAGCSSAGSPHRELVVGTADDPALRVMAEIYAGALRNIGTPVSGDIRTGDDVTLFAEMDRAQLDLFPAFTGQLLHTLAPELTPTGSDEVYSDLNRSLPQGVSVGDATPVSDAPQVFVSTALATSSDASSLADCDRLPAGLPVVTVGEPDPTTMAALAAAGCRFGPVETVGSTQDAFTRIATGRSVGVLSALDAAGAQTTDAGKSSPPVHALRAAPTSTDATTQAAGETTIAAPKGPVAEDLVPVYRTVALTRDEVKQINKVAGEITTADLATLARAAADGANPHDLAVTWLGEHGL